jgi:glycosyltransferase involved in cell wall biosynthesis
MQITIPNEFMPNGHYNIGMTAGIESTVAPADWVQGCGRMNMVLGSSKHSIDILKASTFEKRDERTQQVIEKIAFNPNTKTDILFEGFNEDTYKKTNEILDLPEIRESFCFLFVGHWIQGAFGHDRKNVGVLIKSFLETFKNKAGATPALILKTTGGNSSYMDKYQILKKLKDIKAQVKGKLPKIYLIHGDLTNEEMNQLYNHPKVKCMVNTTKGEGFGRPLLEFTQAKKPIITTGWSGHIDFLKPDMSVLLPGVLNNVHQSAQNKWLIQGSKWFDVDIIALNKALKDMYKNYKQWVIKAKQQGNYAKENFSYTKMKEKFSKILKENVIEAPKQVNLQLPKLKTLSPPKLKLPKLKKIES